MEFQKTLSKTVGPALGYKCYTVTHGVVKYQQKKLLKKSQNINMYVFILEADYDSSIYKKVVFSTFSQLQQFVAWAKNIAEDFEHLQKEKLKAFNQLGTSSTRFTQRLELNLKTRQDEFWKYVGKEAFSVSERV